MRILITDGHSRSALSAVRSLGKCGHSMLVGAKTRHSMAGSSKFCVERLEYPDPAIDPDGFVDRIAHFASDLGIEMILPMTDICVLSLASQRDRFAPHCLLPLPSPESLSHAADKSFVFKRALELGIPIPETVFVDSRARASEAISTLSLPFPVVVKPSRSKVLTNGAWMSTSVGYARSPEALRNILLDLPEQVFPVLLQERIEGPGIGLFYCCDRGRPIASFAHRRLREKPPSGGVSVLRESVEIDPVANRHSVRLLQDLEWHGVAMVELKRDVREGSARLMEVNGRFWGSLQLAVDSGVDFPRILVDMTTGTVANAQPRYEPGVRSRWFWGEVDLLLMYLLKGADRLALPANHGSRLANILKILNPYVRHQRFEVLRLSDLRPWLHESRQWFLRATR